VYVGERISKNIWGSYNKNIWKKLTSLQLRTIRSFMHMHACGCRTESLWCHSEVDLHFREISSLPNTDPDLFQTVRLCTVSATEYWHTESYKLMMCPKMFFVLRYSVNCRLLMFCLERSRGRERDGCSEVGSANWRSAESTRLASKGWDLPGWRSADSWRPWHRQYTHRKT